jgi:hypothetical protein
MTDDEKIVRLRREIADAADRLRPITAALQRGDGARLAASDELHRRIAECYEAIARLEQAGIR